MQRREESNRLLRVNKSVIVLACVLLLFTTEVTALYGQLTPARDLTGRWESAATGMYYSLDPTDATLRMNDITATFVMEITQQGDQINIILHLNMISYVVDQAYWDAYGFAIPEVGGGVIGFAGTVSSSSFSTLEQDTSFNPEHLDGTFTSDIITATLSGDTFETDTNGIVVTRMSSPTARPTQSPLSTPSASSHPTPASTLPPTDPNNLGSVALVRGSASLTNSGGQTQLTSQSQVGSGSQVRTGSDTIVEFRYPDGDSTVYLGEDTEVGWVGLESHPAPDSQITCSMLPADAEHSFDWGAEFKDLLKWTAAGAAFELLATGAINPYIIGGEIVIHGGVILMHYGQFYIRENGWPQLVQVPQGFIQGENTEYTVTVSSDGTLQIQVIEGPLVFLDAVTHNSITVDSNQQLVLTAAQQSGFTQQDLQRSVTAYTPSSSDQWWPAANTSPFSDLLSQPATLFVLIMVIVFAISIPAIVISTRKRKMQTQTPENQTSTGQSYRPPAELSQSNKAGLSATKIVLQAILMLVLLTVIGYFVITLFNSTIITEQELGEDVSIFVFLQVIIIVIFIVGYVGGIAQQIRIYRKIQNPLPTQPGITAPQTTQAPTYKMAAETFPQPPPPPPQQPPSALCPNCGNQLPLSKNFCPICGFQLHPAPPDASKS